MLFNNLDRLFFYLSSNNVGWRLQQARKSRNQSIPTDKTIVFWENRKRIDLCAIDSLSIESHILNINDGWREAIETMINILQQ